MNATSLELRVGLTIFIAALILVVGIMWFQGFKFADRTYEIHAIFPMVGGIDPGDEVNVNGVEKGEVKRVALRDKDVVITMRISADVKIPEDSEVLLQTIGIMGERIVSIVLGESNSYIEPGSMLQGIYDPGLSEVLASFGNVMSDLRELLREIRVVAEALTEGEKLQSTLEDLAEMTEELRRLVADNAPEIEKGVVSFRRSAERMDGLLENNTERIDSMIVSLETVSRELPVLLEKIGNVTGTLSDIAERLKKDDNTIGALMQDRELLDRLERTIESLNELVIDIKANPKRYMKLEIF